MRIDLHTHSNASDGRLAPEALMEAAIAGGLDVVSLTDHDTTAGVPDAIAAAGDAVRVIPGIEVSTTHQGLELHILGYYVDPLHPLLVEHATRAVIRREERMHEMIERLSRLGVHVSFEDVVEEAGPDAAALGRPHLARVLVQHGYVPSVGQAFNRYLADGGPAFRPTELLSPAEAVELIHAAGGLASWAHPDLDVFDREIRRFAEAGLDAVECFRPRTPPAESLLFEQAARGLGLIPTGGSDWHGVWHGALGDFHVRRRDVPELLEAGGL